MKTRAIVLALALITTAQGTAAQTRGPRLDVAVRIAHVAVLGDTVEIGYVLENRRGTPMSIGTLAIPTRATIVSLEAPHDRHDWETFGNHGDEPMATWAAMGDAIRAGESSPTLTMRAIGATDLVSYFAVPDITETMKHDTIQAERRADRYVEWGARGTTVTVTRPPANKAPSPRIARIMSFLDRSCGAEAWITDRGTCDALKGILQQATAAGSFDGARPHLARFLTELEAARGKMSMTAYALLMPNVAFLLR